MVRVRHVRFYKNQQGSPIAREELLGLPEDGQVALLDLARRFERDELRRAEVKHLRDGLYELRTEVAGNQYRAIFFYDGSHFVIIALCFVKKQKKTPDRFIELALARKKTWQEHGRVKSQE